MTNNDFFLVITKFLTRNVGIKRVMAKKRLIVITKNLLFFKMLIFLDRWDIENYGGIQKLCRVVVGHASRKVEKHWIKVLHSVKLFH